jgi:hypothetical protein
MSRQTIVLVLVSFAALAFSEAARATDIRGAVEDLKDGTVWMTFAARDGVCGDGINSISLNCDSRRVHIGDDIDYERDCDDGPIRVSMRVRDGEVTRIKTRVGGSWHTADEGVVDLGEVPPQEAADFLLDIAARSRRAVAEDAILPAVLARDVVVWPRVLEIARDDERPHDVRESAVFWVGQLAGEKVTEELVAIVEDDDEDMEVREAALFALSQWRGRNSTDRLMKIARNNPNPRLRRSAMFWLSQSDDPRVLDFFEEILLGE